MWHVRWSAAAVLPLILFVAVVALLSHTDGRQDRRRAAAPRPLEDPAPPAPLHEEWASYIEAGKRGQITTPTSAPSRIRRVFLAGRHAYAITVRAGDRDAQNSTAQRTELAQGNPSKAFADGDRRMRASEERWIAERIWIPASAPTGDRNYRFYGINQFKTDGSGGPAVGLSFEDDRLIVDRASAQDYGSTGQTDLWSSPVVPRDRWLKLLWHIRWSTGSDGLIELFGDLADGRGYRQLMPRHSGWTLKYDASGNPGAVHPRIGIYRRAIDVDTTIFFADYSVGPSRTAAEATLDIPAAATAP